MMIGPLSIGRPSGDLRRFLAGHLRLGFGNVIGGLPLSTVSATSAMSSRPDGKQVEVERRNAENAASAC